MSPCSSASAQSSESCFRVCSVAPPGIAFILCPMLSLGIVFIVQLLVLSLLRGPIASPECCPTSGHQQKDQGRRSQHQHHAVVDVIGLGGWPRAESQRGNAEQDTCYCESV